MTARSLIARISFLLALAAAPQPASFDAGKARKVIRDWWTFESDIIVLLPEDEQTALRADQKRELDLDLRSLSAAQLRTLGGDVKRRASTLEATAKERGLIANTADAAA